MYVTKEMMEKASNLKLILTAGVGSDHVDLGAAAENNITVAEQTASNVVSVAEHAVMCILNLVRNFIPQYHQVTNGEWDIAGLAKKAYDLEGKTVGIYGAGAIGQLVAMRLKAFDVKMYYYKRTRLSNVEEAVCGFRYVRLDDMMKHCDIVVIEAPLTPETEGLFDHDVLFGMKKGAWLVNTSRGAIVDRDALVEALEQGHLAGYAGYVWDPEPAPPDHPWRNMPNHMMTPHTAGTTLDAQKHYAEDTRRCLEAFFAGEQIEQDHLIVDGGEIVSGTHKAIYSS